MTEQSGPTGPQDGRRGHRNGGADDTPARSAPATSVEARRLARELSELRRRTGLSLAALSERTTASKSSWHRYLGGSKLPPAGLVRELCDLANEPPGRLLALWELAQAAQTRGHSERPAGHAASASGASPGRRGGALLRRWRGSRRGTRAALLAVATAVAVVAVVLAGWTVVRTDAPPPAGSGAPVESGPPGGAPAPSPSPPPGCHGEACTGLSADQQGCTLPWNGLVTVVEHRFPDGTRMEIRYSEVCEAGWSRIWAAQVGDRIETRLPGVEPQEAVIVDEQDQAGYVATLMLAGPVEELTACLIRDEEVQEPCLGT